MAGALVLTGGASRRMGRSKAWLELHGRPLLSHIAELLAARCRPLVVVAAAGQRLPPLPPAAERLDDPVADAGPLWAVAAGLEHLAAASVATAYLASCDAAALTRAHVDAMLAELERSGAAAVVPVAAGRRHPLAAALRVAPMRARARRLIAAHERRLQQLFAVPEVAELPVQRLPDPRVLAPCNTPEQWARLRAELADEGERSPLHKSRKLRESR